MTKPIIGIDLGTTYSLVSVFQDGQARVLPNALGERLTPSAVALDDAGRVLVGAAAKAIAVVAPQRAQVDFKRDMGTPAMRRLGDRMLSPQELSALVLGSLKRDAEAALGMAIDEAVVTVPAYFGDPQRQATKDAGAIAGLKVERIINEPTAAALAYGLHARGREARVAVLDLGGGTFDVTLLEIIEGVIEIQASAGDARLGGEDFDTELARAVLKQVGASGGEADARAFSNLREACEAAKRRLTGALRTPLTLPDWAADGHRQAIALDLDRAFAERAWAPLLERLRAPVQQALRDAGWAPSQVDEVLLVGGSTRMPCVAEVAAKVLGRLPLRSLPPDEAIALGAAVQGALKAGDAGVEDLVVTDVAPFSMGVSTVAQLGTRRVSGVFSPVLERGTTIPASRVERYRTAGDLQRIIELEVYQGEHSSCDANVQLGTFRIENIPPSPAGEQAIDVRFTYDLNGILEVEVTLVSTGHKQAFVVEQRPGKMTAEQVAKAREAMAAYKQHPRELLPNTTALARADALHVHLTGEPRQVLAAAIAHFRAALETQDAAVIQGHRERLTALIGHLRQA